MTTMTSKEHDGAVQRLQAQLLEQHRLDERYHDAIGTTTELGAYDQLRAAGDQVAMLHAWLHWVDDEAYRGLNAGPFELLAESSARGARLSGATVAVSPDGSRRTARAEAGSSQEEGQE
jgi:hypothetical protein